MKIIDCYNLLLEAGIATATKLFDEGQAEIKDLEYNSKHAVSGTLFFCKGENFKEKYLIDAVDKGACCYVSEKLIRGESAHKPSVILVNDIRKAMAVLSKAFYYPEDKLKIIGVTGTKGKSTTIYMLKEIFNMYSDKVAFISGIEIDDGTGIKGAVLTTPETVDLYKYLSNAVNSGKEYMLAEISSQALKYGRCDGITFDNGAFLNISNDHISPREHPSFEDYLKSKVKIFDSSRRVWVNSETDFFDDIMKYAEGKCEIKTYGSRENDDIMLTKLEETPEVLKLKINGEEEFNLSMGGEFNASNALCAIALAKDYDIPSYAISEALNNVFIPGRMEVFNSADKKIVAIIDYAHNGVSFEKIFKHIRKNYPNRKIAVSFGCVGGKAYNRRHETGEVASLYADSIYIVPNNPAEEDYKDIGKEIVGYMNPGPKVIEIMDSREAGIKEAFKAASKSENDWVILVLGKSREESQNYGIKKVKCRTNYEVVKEQINILNQK